MSLRTAAGNGVLAGRVTDADTGAPLNEIRVTIYDADYDFVNTAQTLESGYYTFTNLIEGEYILYFRADLGFESENYVAEFYNCNFGSIFIAKQLSNINQFRKQGRFCILCKHKCAIYLKILIFSIKKPIGV